MNEIGARAVRQNEGQREKPSPWVKFGIEMGPLMLFFVANAYPKLFAPAAALFLAPSVLNGPNAGLFTATAVLMVAVAVALAVSFVVARRLPAVPLMTAVLVLVFGGLTLYLQNATFIKMKPTVLYAGFGTALIGGLAMNKLILPIIFDHALALSERGWRLLTLRWGSFFFLLAFLNEIVWRSQSNDVWVAFKFPGIFVLICLFSIAQMPLIGRHKLPDAEAASAPDHF
ncbi:septation protein A [Methylocapsa sp. D3K7]|nr:septation protein A [Methylocapsa sp. D3K7]WGJ15650.1 septation protein A [Methylocapsa sp. D3K7]